MLIFFLFLNRVFIFFHHQNIKKELNSKHTGHMINKGKTGRWKEHFDNETIKRFQQWEQKHLEGTGLSFIYEI